MKAASAHTATLAAFGAEARFGDLAASTVEASNRVILDTLGCAVGGRGLASSTMVRDVKVALGGTPQATVLVGGERLSVAATAAVNGHYANALDAEETILHSGHLAATVVPAAVAAAELTGASGADLVAAVAVGFDVAARIGLSLRHLDVLEDGSVQIAPVAGLTWASFGATVAMGRLLGLDADRMADAFGITVAAAPLPIAGQWGTLARPRPMTKYGMYGVMAEAGITAALLAAEGFSGDRTILDGERGFWRIMGSRRCAWEMLTDRLGTRWLVEETSFKLYPACRFATPALDLYYALTERHGINADDIERVEVLVPQAMIVKHMDDPEVATLVDGQFSVPHVIGLAARYGPPSPEWHSAPGLVDPGVQEFASRVDVRINPDATAILARLLEEKGHAELIPTAMTITTASGDRFSANSDHGSGDPWADDGKISEELLKSKFQSFCAPHLPASQVATAIELIGRLDSAPDVRALIETLVTADAG